MAEFLNNNIKYLRAKEGISQQGLADKIGIDRSTVSRIENNEIETTIDNAIKIAKALNVTIYDLVGRDLRLAIDENTSPIEKKHEEYKRILREKGLMDENENIDEESLNKLLKIADMIDGINKKEN